MSKNDLIGSFENFFLSKKWKRGDCQKSTCIVLSLFLSLRLQVKLTKTQKTDCDRVC